MEENSGRNTFETVSNLDPVFPDNGDLDSGNGDQGYDFSYLPEPVWVKVLEFLPLADQYHVSTTCHALYDVFNHPSNWKCARMDVVGGEHNFRLTKSFMADKFRIIVEKFGHYFQSLTISVHGHLVAMDTDVKDILLELAKVCRLEHLVLQVGLVTSGFHLHGLRPLPQALSTVAELICSAWRLKRLDVASWPMFPEVFADKQLNVFEVMKSNPKLAQLESLSLFLISNKSQWSERSPLLPSPEYTCELVSHFHCLHHLALRSPMLSDALLEELSASSRHTLTSLHILLQTLGHFHSPGLQASSWRSLRHRSPKLEVEVTTMSYISDVVMDTLLSPEMPLAACNILRYARCSPALLMTLSGKFKATLRSLVCYSEPTDCGEALMQLVENCERLDSLLFLGTVHCDKLKTIAQARTHWRQFHFRESSIITEPDNHFDDDVVIARAADGELVQVGMVRFHGQQSDADRQQELEALQAIVSPRLDRGWKPE